MLKIKHIVEWANATPKKLFLLDGIGALLSVILLGVVLVDLEFVFGIPKQTLYILASLPCIFAIYDFYCYLKIDKNIGIFLKVIAIINLIYCCLSIGLAIHHSQEITKYGWIYLIIEVLIVSLLAYIELRVAKNQISQSIRK